MKLLAARIRNFRLLKKLDLNFSVSDDKPLTVIRAANETGKTTTLNALVWCLYGSQALPNKGGYSLFPSDETGSDEYRVEVSVEIEFELEHVSSLGMGRHEYRKQKYRLLRVCKEGQKKNSNVVREGETRTLWKINSSGTEKIQESDVPAIIDNALPQPLKDVYFTDGDSAMSFIEAAASQGVKRKRVTNAIESLLGLKILDKTITHLESASRKFSHEIDNKDYAKELEGIDDKICGYEEDLGEASQELDESRHKLEFLQKELNGLDDKIEKALVLGDKEKLVRDRQVLLQGVAREEASRDESYKSLSGIVSSESVATSLLGRHINRAKDLLNHLHECKQLPKVNVPILEELLDRDYCFCGSELKAGTNEGDVRRKEIREAIEASRASDRIQESATSLFYQIRSVSPEGAGESWMTAYGSEATKLMNSLKNIRVHEHDLERIEEDIKQIDDSHLIKLREQREKLREEQQKLRGVEATRASQIEEHKNRLADLETERRKVRNKLGKTNTSTTNWDVANAVKSVFSQIKGRLLKEELSRVSAEMNRIFLSMIGSGSEDSDFSRIRRAELTPEFDIAVYGPSDHELNPDQDLNGASRRAITLAFILALTKVSEVEAPNIIDTPLGMMAGYVKQSVLLNTIREGAQVILFLTHDEIKGVEDIIDKYAGVVFTLTNPAHYPTMLANKPEKEEMGVVRCECGHRDACDVCERKGLEVA